MNKPNLRIHIAPVGYEIDRIVLPARERRADRVYLMVHENPGQDKALRFIEAVKERLEEQNIEVRTADHDRLDLFSIIKAVKEIIRGECGNNVYVNLASGSKIQAVGGMMACMMFNEENNVIPFYVEAEEYASPQNEQSSSGIREIMDIPPYEIQKPAEKLIRALRIVRDKGRISKKEMADLCDEEEIIKVDPKKTSRSQALFTSLDMNIIQPLKVQWGFIEEEKIGRSRWLEITEDGKNAAKFLI